MSARLPAAKSSAQQSKEKKTASKEAVTKDFKFDEVFILPLDSKSVPSTETEKDILAQRGRVWQDYTFRDADDTRLDFKLRGGVEVAKDYHSGEFFCCSMRYYILIS